MRYAYALAKQYGAHLYFLHVVQDAWSEPISTRVSATSFCRLRLHEEGLSEITNEIEAEFLVEFGSAEELTLETARKREVQLVVLSVPGTTHPALSTHLPGPVAYNIVSHAPCPVLGVRAKPDVAKDEDVNGRSAAD
jgi:nucleotide-binding universal stress UspA family protein